MTLASALRERLARGGAVHGSWLSLGSIPAAEIMAGAGYDFLGIDMEHAPIGVETAAGLIRVVEQAGCSPLVRMPSHDPALAKTLLDAGAHGLIFPDVRSAEMARQAVRSTRYPPAGTRGVGLHRAQGYGPGFREYFESANDGVLVVAQIESAEAIADIAGITEVDGIDAVMIGPYDLSADLGVPGDFSAAPFTDAVRTVITQAASAGVAAGFHLVEPDLDALEACILAGYRFIVFSVDMRILDVGARQGARALGARE